MSVRFVLAKRKEESKELSSRENKTKKKIPTTRRWTTPVWLHTLPPASIHNKNNKDVPPFFYKETDDHTVCALAPAYPMPRKSHSNQSLLPSLIDGQMLLAT